MRNCVPPVVYAWYCIRHGDVILTNDDHRPDNPCNANSDCDCEIIYKIVDFETWIRIGKNRHVPIERYLREMNDGYQFEYLENLVENYFNNF